MKGQIKYADLTSEDHDVIEVEVLPELGFPNKFKLYIHINGVTQLRVHELSKEQIKLSVGQALLAEPRQALIDAAYERGREDAYSRSRNKPGAGDMGG
jgi:hypothetical protein